MNRFKDLKVWEEAVLIATDIYKITSKFPRSEQFGMTSQLNRAVVSISSNIAEGAGRNSNKEFYQFLGIAIGFSCEVESLLKISNNLGMVTSDDLQTLSSQLLSIQNKLFELQQALKAKELKVNSQSTLVKRT